MESCNDVCGKREPEDDTCRIAVDGHEEADADGGRGEQPGAVHTRKGRDGCLGGVIIQRLMRRQRLAVGPNRGTEAGHARDQYPHAENCVVGVEDTHHPGWFCT